jgi:hypothetical protein
MTHKSEIIEATPLRSGMLAVKVRCCGDPETDSILTLHELHRDEAEIDKDIQAHQARVEGWHEGDRKALEHVRRLIKK